MVRVAELATARWIGRHANRACLKHVPSSSIESATKERVHLPSEKSVYGFVDVNHSMEAYLANPKLD